MPVEKNVCAFCRHAGKEQICGKLYCQKLPTGILCAHKKCMQYSAKLAQCRFPHFGGFDIEEVQQEIKRGKKLKCYWCKKEKNGRITGATSGCELRSCPRSFHFYCARVNPESVTCKRKRKDEDGEFVHLYWVFCSEEHKKEYMQTEGKQEESCTESDEEESLQESSSSTRDSFENRGTSSSVSQLHEKRGSVAWNECSNTSEDSGNDNAVGERNFRTSSISGQSRKAGSSSKTEASNESDSEDIVSDCSSESYGSKWCQLVSNESSNEFFAQQERTKRTDREQQEHKTQGKQQGEHPEETSETGFQPSNQLDHVSETIDFKVEITDCVQQRTQHNGHGSSQKKECTDYSAQEKKKFDDQTSQGKHKPKDKNKLPFSSLPSWKQMQRKNCSTVDSEHEESGKMQRKRKISTASEGEEEAPKMNGTSRVDNNANNKKSGNKKQKLTTKQEYSSHELESKVDQLRSSDESSTSSPESVSADSPELRPSIDDAKEQHVEENYHKQHLESTSSTSNSGTHSGTHDGEEDFEDIDSSILDSSEDTYSSQPHSETLSDSLQDESESVSADSSELGLSVEDAKEQHVEENSHKPLQEPTPSTSNLGTYGGTSDEEEDNADKDYSTSDSPEDTYSSQPDSLQDESECLLVIPQDAQSFRHRAADVQRKLSEEYSIKDKHIHLWDSLHPALIPPGYMTYFFLDITSALKNRDLDSLRDLLLNASTIRRKWDEEYKEKEELPLGKAQGLISASLKEVREKNKYNLGIFTHSSEVYYLFIFINVISDPQQKIRCIIHRQAFPLRVEDVISFDGLLAEHFQGYRCMESKFLHKWLVQKFSENYCLVNLPEEKILLNTTTDCEEPVSLKSMLESRSQQTNVVAADLPIIVFISAVDTSVVCFRLYLEKYFKQYAKDLDRRNVVFVFPVENLSLEECSQVQLKTSDCKVSWWTAFVPSQRPVSYVIGELKRQPNEIESG